MATEIGFLLKVQGGKEALDDVTKFTLRLQEIPAALKAAKSAGDKELFAKLKGEQIELRNQLSSTTRELNKQVSNFEKSKFPTDSIVAMEARYSELRDTIRRTSQTDPGFNKMVTEARALKDEIRQVSENFGDTTPNIGNYREAIEKALQGQGTLIDNFKKATTELITSPEAVAVGVVGIVTGALSSVKEFGDQVIEQNKRLSDSIADVRKSTGGTQEELDALFQSLLARDTRTNIFDQLDIAKIGGQLGVAKQDLFSFTEALDKTVVALGDELGGGVEGIASDLGKLATVLGVKDEFGIGESINKIGSAINTLGAEGTANGAFIVDFSSRLSGLASTAGITAPQLLGLAATADELGLRSESSSTALGQLLIEIGSNVPKFANIAGVSVDELNSTLAGEGGAVSALIQVLEGANNTGGGLESLAGIIETFGIEGSKSAELVASLSGNIDLLREKQISANKAFTEGVSITEEFDIKNNTFAASTEKLANQWTRLLFSIDSGQGIISNFFKRSTDATSEFLESLQALNDGYLSVLDLFSGADAINAGKQRAKDASKIAQETTQAINAQQDLLVKGLAKTGLTAEQIAKQTGKNIADVNRALGIETSNNFEAISRKLSSASEGFTEKTKTQAKETEKTVKEVAATAGSLSALKKELSAIQQTIDTSGENVLEAELQKLISKQAEIETLEAKIAKIKNTLAGENFTPSGIEPVRLPTLNALGDDASIDVESTPEIENYNRIQEALKVLKEEKDLDERQRLLDSAQLSIENDELTLEQRKELYKKFYDETGELGKKFEENNKKAAQEVVTSMNNIINTTVNAARQGQNALQSFLKATGIELLNAIERQIDVLLVRILAQELATKSFAGIATAATLGVLVKGALAVAKSRIQTFAEGGKVNPEKIGEGVITARSNISPLPNGDNVLAFVRTGETVVNERQVNEIGVDRFRRARVPGYADGGIVGGSRGIPSVINPSTVSQSVGFTDEQVDRFARISAQGIATETARETARQVAESVRDAMIQVEEERQAYSDLRNTYG